ncbi:MAG TPA: serine hydrolase [Gemmatimonadaceae bacterium]|nr:serine hydrolase [Gemmatimonadaceae bacterium]
MTAGICLIGCAGAHEPGAGPPPGPAVTAPVVLALQDTVGRVLATAFADTAFPGAIAIVGNRRGELAEVSIGNLTWGEPARVDRHTIWDLASLTKVMGTATAMMRLVDAGRVDVDAPVQRYLPDWTGPGKSAVTVRHLLTHTSGLPSFKAYDRITTERDSIDKLMFATPLDSAPGRAMIYSDIGGYLLGRIIAKASGQPFDEYVEGFYRQLGMNETMFNPPASLYPRVAPTEIDTLRGGLVRGKVHDERAYYLGGVSGHAGLFSSAHDLSKFARLLLNGGAIGDTVLVSQATLARFSAFDDSSFSNRGLGWQKPTLPGMRFSTAGPWASSRSISSAAYGHTGFTGTSIIIDPVNDLYVILLSNRVNPTRNNPKIGGVRTRLTNAVYSVLRRNGSS